MPITLLAVIYTVACSDIYLIYFASVCPAGYNNVEVAEFLLDHGADVNAQDKGGLIPLHNASSYGHLDIAALLIKFNTVVNATDKWGFTPLHEAAQKGRTQLCALLVINFDSFVCYNYNNCLFLARAWGGSVFEKSRGTGASRFGIR